MFTCGVCCDDVKDLATCKDCRFEVCVSCARRYLLESTRDSADCMKCHAIWNREKLLDTFTKQWVTGEWKKHRETVLFERERGMMPATQLYINWLTQFEELKTRRKTILMEINRLKSLNTSAANQQLRALRLERRQLQVAITTQSQNDPTLPQTRTQTQTHNKQLACPCPVEGCMGFVEASSWQCGICKTLVCKECYEVTTHVHVCKHENVLTAQALKKESKPCPHCAVPTFRISGCSQMWCVICHKPWDWNTGVKVNEGEVIHNPHYFEWAGRNGEREGLVWLAPDERWQHDPTVLPPLQLQIRASRTPDDVRKLSILNRRLAHLWGEERRKLTERNLHDNLDLRVRFMRRQVTDVQFMRLLQQREKKNAKCTEYATVLSNCYLATVTHLKQLCIDLILNPLNADLCLCFQMIESLRSEFDERLLQVAAQYDAVPPKYFKEEFWIDR